MEHAIRQTIIRTYSQPLVRKATPAVRLTILQRLHANEKAAVADCISEYGNKVWAFAKHHTRSSFAAESLAEEIFEDIWVYAGRNGANARTAEDLIIENIAFRRLIKNRWESNEQF